MVALRPVRDRDGLEGVVLVHNVGVLAGRGPVARDADSRRTQPDSCYKAIGFRIRQRLEQKSIDYAEDSGVGTDADGKGKHDYQREARGFPHGAERITDVGEERTHEG